MLGRIGAEASARADEPPLSLDTCEPDQSRMNAKKGAAMTMTETAVKADAVMTTGARMRASDPIYGDILDFLIGEAALLDDDRHDEWLNCLTDDVTYKMPVRKTLYKRDGPGFDGRTGHWDDNRMSLGMRARRSVELPSAYDRDPPPRIRRMVTNLIVHETDEASEYKATTNMLLLRSRFDAPTCEMLSGKREDVIRRDDNGTLKLARRLVLLDQSVLGGIFINVFM